MKSNSVNRILSASLAAIMLASVSCGGSGVSDDTTAASDTTTAPIEEIDENSRKYAKDDLPELDFEGAKIRVLSRVGDEDCRIEFNVEEESGDVVEDAVYNRNLAVEERLNVEIVNLQMDVNRHDFPTDDLKNSVLAGSDDYDVFSGPLARSANLITAGYFTDFTKLDYIDLDKPWWNQSHAELSALDGRLFAVTGELALTMISGAYCVFFNSDIFKEYHPDVNLYEVVLNGEWTLDKLYDLCKGTYRDLNGNTQFDENDFAGLYVREKQCLMADAMVGGANLELAVFTDGKESMEMTVVTERSVELVEKIRQIVYDTTTTVRGSYNDETVMTPMNNGTCIFTPWMLGAINYLRDMKDDYGIVPMPKLNDAQEEYTTYSHNGLSIFAIPKTCTDPNRTAAFLEAMAAATYRSVTPVYFETAMKVKYARDNETSQMLDMIVESVYLDAATAYGSLIGGPLDIFRNTFISSAECDSFTSTVASKQAQYNSLIKKLYSDYKLIES